MARSEAQRLWRERNRDRVREQQRAYQRKLRLARAPSAEQRRAAWRCRNLASLSAATGWNVDECWSIVERCLPHLHPLLQQLAIDRWFTGLKQSEVAAQRGHSQANMSLMEAKLVKALQLLRSLPLSIEETIAAVESSNLSAVQKTVLIAYLTTNSQTRAAETLGLAQATVCGAGPRYIWALRAEHPEAAETCELLWKHHNALNHVDVWGTKRAEDKRKVKAALTTALANPQNQRVLRELAKL